MGTQVKSGDSVGSEPGEATTALSALQTNSGSEMTSPVSVVLAGTWWTPTQTSEAVLTFQRT